MAKLSESVLKELIQGGETNTVELKLAAPRPVELGERLCGLANAQGGVVIIGVEDASRKVVGVPDERMALTLDTVLRAARQNVKPTLVLEPPEPEVYVIDGKKLVVATIGPSMGPVYQSGGVCWVRRGTHTMPLSVPELLELANDRGLQDWELQPARRATMQDLDMEKVEAHLKRRASGNRQAGRFNEVEQVLIGMECATVTNNGEIVPTNAGILFFGHDPQKHLMQSEVVCVLFRDAVAASRYADRKIMRGTLQELIDEAEAFLNRYIAVGARIEGWKRIDIPEHSIEALREAVINAVVHRDYSKRGESVRIFYYADRVEIHSPGLLMPGITVEQMERGMVQSKLRNPVLASLLRDVPGYMERIGSGVRFMLEETKRSGLPAPEFREMGEFVVTFRAAPALSTPQPQFTGTLRGEDEPLQPISSVPERRGGQEERLIKAVQHVNEHGFITNAMYRQLTGVSDRTAHRDLETLIERGRLKGVGQKRARRYELP